MKYNTIFHFYIIKNQIFKCNYYNNLNIVMEEIKIKKKSLINI